MKLNLLGVISLFCLMAMSLGNAQISLAPLYAKLEPEPNGQMQTTFVVANDSDEPVRFRARFSPFNFDETTIQLLDNIDDGSDLSSYLRAAPLEFEIPAFGSQIIRIIALVPPSILAEELRAALILEPLLDESTFQQSNNDALSGQILLTYRFAAQIYIGGAGTANMQIKNVKYNPDEGMRVIISNDTSVSGIINVEWKLLQEEKEVAESQEPARFIVLKQDQRTNVLASSLELKPGEYTLTGTFGTEDGGEPPVVLNPQPFTKTFTVK